MRRKEVARLLQKVRDLEASELAFCQQVDSLKGDNNDLREEHSRIAKLLKESNEALELMDKTLKLTEVKADQQDILIRELNTKTATAEQLVADMFERINATTSEKRASEALLESEKGKQEKNAEAIKDLQKKLLKIHEAIQEHAVESVVNCCILEAAFTATLAKNEKRPTDVNLVMNEVYVNPPQKNKPLSSESYFSCTDRSLNLYSSAESTSNTNKATGMLARFMSFCTTIWALCWRTIACW